jgi:hypothetical protein
MIDAIKSRALSPALLGKIDAFLQFDLSGMISQLSLSNVQLVSQGSRSLLSKNFRKTMIFWQKTGLINLPR